MAGEAVECAGARKPIPITQDSITRYSVIIESLGAIQNPQSAKRTSSMEVRAERVGGRLREADLEQVLHHQDL
jgi:hypothetical protein